MTTRKCCVQTCNKPDGNILLHKFPHPIKDSARFAAWTAAIGEEVALLDNMTIFKQYRLCNLHFESKYHSNSGRVTRNAIPTLSLSGHQVLVTEEVEDIKNSNYSILPSSSRQAVQAEITELTSTAESISNVCQQLTYPILKENTNQKTSTEFVLRNKIKKLQIAKESIAAKLRKALKLSQNRTFQRALKNFSEVAVIFTMMQFREIGKKKLGRRFKKTEKAMALALYKQGPKAYRWLQRFFVLPSPLTLSRMIKCVSLKPGLNENKFKGLKKRK